jgi:hypothetical protein
MKKYIPILLFCCIASSLLFRRLFAQGPAISGNLGIVSAPLANVHEEPLPRSRLETQVLMGDEVRILEKRDNRYRISIPSQENREGWIQQEAVQIPKDKGRGFLNTTRQWVVITRPKAEALILDKTGNHKVTLYAGTRLPVLEQTTPARDYKVLFPDRSAAIISAMEAMPVKTFDPLLNNTRPGEIAKTAALFQGVRHLSGGITAQGMDTNGLIYVSYRVHGIPTGADRASLRANGERISKKDLEPGDILVFYGDGRGLYVGSGGSCTSAEGVCATRRDPRQALRQLSSNTGSGSSAPGLTRRSGLRRCPPTRSSLPRRGRRRSRRASASPTGRAASSERRMTPIRSGSTCAGTAS